MTQNVSKLDLLISDYDEDDLINITYQKPKTTNSKEQCLDEEISEHFTKLSIENPVSRKNMCHSEVMKEHYVGLVNQAMTCYLNSLLQAFYMTPEFRNALYSWKYKQSEKDEEANAPFQIQKLFLNLQTSQKLSIETNSLTESFGWNSSEAWQQEDIQEFCRVIFDSLEDNLKNSLQADLVKQLYEGKINDTIKCLNCNTVKSREDTFLNIPLSVKSFDETCASVEGALKAFVKCETLEGNDQYFCYICKKKTDAQKELKFKKFPYILMLQLKRFYFNQNTNNRIKLNDRVTFPEILNLNSFVDSTFSQETPSLEKDIGLCVKCNDNCVTDSSSVEEECVPSNVTDSSRNYLTNHDDLEDEGIVMSNDILHSSKNNEKGQHNYIYELFCIMIHSGSAKSGHYYAYIKDFRTGEWLCFNDEKVSSINIEDIQKTYGGDGKSIYYSQSTNAYMLMYRQIDPERNCLPMKEEDFPAHIKELLEKIKNEDNSVKCKNQENPKKRSKTESPNVNKQLTTTVEEVHNEKTRSKKAVNSVNDVKKTKEKKLSKINETAVEVEPALLEKIHSNLAPKKTEPKTTTNKRVKKVRGSDSDYGSEVSRLPKRSTRKSRLHISSGNPKPLRRSAYLLHNRIENYYSLDSDDSTKSVKND